MALSGDVPFAGSEKQYKDRETNSRNNSITGTLIDFVATDRNISKVFIVSRGRCYLTGQDNAFQEKINEDYVIPSDVFRQSLQETVKILAESGKQVYIVS